MLPGERLKRTKINQIKRGKKNLPSGVVLDTFFNDDSCTLGEISASVSWTTSVESKIKDASEHEGQGEYFFFFYFITAEKKER